jgi:hypothetical protein
MKRKRAASLGNRKRRRKTKCPFPPAFPLLFQNEKEERQDWGAAALGGWMGKRCRSWFAGENYRSWQGNGNGSLRKETCSIFKIVKEEKQMDEVLEEMLDITLKKCKLYLVMTVRDLRRIVEITKGFLKQLYHTLIGHRQCIGIGQLLLQKQLNRS